MNEEFKQIDPSVVDTVQKGRIPNLTSEGQQMKNGSQLYIRERERGEGGGVEGWFCSEHG